MIRRGDLGMIIGSGSVGTHDKVKKIVKNLTRL